MAYTPYPSDALENPCIIASNDGTTWDTAPNGLVNPVDPLPGDPEMVNGNRFNSDTDIVHHDGTLYAFWRFREPGQFWVRVRTSTDGITWTPRQTVIQHATDPFVSPMVLVIDGVWHMWTGDNTRPQQLWHRTAPDVLGPWSTRELCTVGGMEAYWQAWHFDVIRHEGILIGLFDLQKFEATNIGGTLYLAVSLDGISWQLGPAIISAPKPAPGYPRTWDSNIIYRCTGVVAPDGETLRVWYSAMPKIGYTEVPLRLIQPALDALRASA